MEGIVPQPNARSLYEKLDAIAVEAAGHLGCDTVLISIQHDEALHSLGAFPALEGEVSARAHARKDTVCHRTIEMGTPLRLPDARIAEGFSNLRYVREGFVVGYLGVPIRNTGIGTVGSLCSISATPREWTPLEIGYLEQVSKNVELILLNDLFRLEMQELSATLTELDKIIVSLSQKRTIPTSIYDESGALIYANSELMADIEYNYVESRSFDANNELSCGSSAPYPLDNTSTQTEDFIFYVDAPRIEGATKRLRVNCSVAESGFTVCTWNRTLEVVYARRRSQSDVREN
jgi:hypothetical protein